MAKAKRKTTPGDIAGAAMALAVAAERAACARVAERAAVPLGRTYLEIDKMKWMARYIAVLIRERGK